MFGFRKRHLVGIATAILLLVAGPPVSGQAPGDTEKLDTLFAQLAEPGREDWERVEGEITRIWSRSGSPAMDLLLRRGNEALEAENYDAALEHLTALTRLKLSPSNPGGVTPTMV
jgi:hypothetical protein